MLYLLLQAKNEQVARELCDSRAASSRNQLERSKVGGLVAGEDGRAVIPLVVRGDVTGSVEVLVELLRSKQPEELELNVVATGVGGVTEGDVEMAASTGGEGHYTTTCTQLNGIMLVPDFFDELVNGVLK